MTRYNIATTTERNDDIDKAIDIAEAILDGKTLAPASSLGMVNRMLGTLKKMKAEDEEFFDWLDKPDPEVKKPKLYPELRKEIFLVLKQTEESELKDLLERESLRNIEGLHPKEVDVFTRTKLRIKAQENANLVIQMKYHIDPPDVTSIRNEFQHGSNHDTAN